MKTLHVALAAAILSELRRSCFTPDGFSRWSSTDPDHGAVLQRIATKLGGNARDLAPIARLVLDKLVDAGLVENAGGIVRLTPIGAALG